MKKLRATIQTDNEGSNVEKIIENLKNVLNLNTDNSLLEIVEDEEYDVILLWHSQKRLLKLLSEQVSISGQVSINQGEDNHLKLDFVNPQENNKKIVPIIHLSNITLIPTKEGEQEKIEKRRNQVKWSRHISRIDSSIWHYYYSLEEHFNNPKTKTLETIVYEISRNLSGINTTDEDEERPRGNRYELSVAKEYEEFYSRISNSSYICNTDGGHSANVSPFLFHSEQFMRVQVYKNNKEQLSHNLNWRILLVDDHATTPMSNSSHANLSKLDIIKEDLERIGFTADDSRVTQDNHFIEFECVTSVQKAVDLIKKDKQDKENKYDIILLDYKLAEQSGKQEYGYELLRVIHKDQESKNPQLSPGPNDTYYFMFISAYTTAVQERLQMEGFYVSKDYWFIGRGACPTNTPYLFLYSLKRMMDIRYDKLTKHSKQLLKDLNKQKKTKSGGDIEKEKGKYATMTMFLTKLYEKDNERNNCVLGFNAFLNLRRVYDTIKHDVNHDKNLNEEERRMKSSPLIMSLFKDEEFCSNSFWEHLQNLVYLTAFGTIRQWPEMWEDYTFIKTKLEKAEGVIWKDPLNDEQQKITRPSILIRNYILSLKGMMS